MRPCSIFVAAAFSIGIASPATAQTKPVESKRPAQPAPRKAVPVRQTETLQVRRIQEPRMEVYRGTIRCLTDGNFKVEQHEGDLYVLMDFRWADTPALGQGQCMRHSGRLSAIAERRGEGTVEFKLPPSPIVGGHSEPHLRIYTNPMLTGDIISGLANRNAEFEVEVEQLRSGVSGQLKFRVTRILRNPYMR